MNATTRNRTAKQTAAEAYAARKADIASLLDLIQQEVEVHAEEAAKDPTNWGHAGDLGHIRQNLVETLQFLMLERLGNSEEKAARFIEKHLEEMREE